MPSLALLLAMFLFHPAIHSPQFTDHMTCILFELAHAVARCLHSIHRRGDA